MNIGPTGIWDCESIEPHSFDTSLMDGIIKFIREYEITEVVDLGCGSGAYVWVLNKSGIPAAGYDGNPSTNKFNHNCHVMDLSQACVIDMGDLVLSLETGEHIPREFEANFLDNVCLTARSFVILSWFPTPGHGIGHVNERSNEWVKQEMLARGFHSMEDWQTKLRDSSTLWWFKESLMVFTRK